VTTLDCWEKKIAHHSKTNVFPEHTRVEQSSRGKTDPKMTDMTTNGPPGGPAVVRGYKIPFH
jgi:hypothetical protein